jgi:hypothetical protein
MRALRGGEVDREPHATVVEDDQMGLRRPTRRTSRYRPP